MKKVLIPQAINRPGEIYLEERGYEIIRGTGSDESTMMREATDCDAILIRNAIISDKVMDAASELKVIGRHGVGFDNIDVKHAEKKGIWVVIAAEANYNAVAEHAMMFILACAKNFRIIDLHYHANDYYIGHKVQNMEIQEKTLGIIGLGKIGQSLAKKAHFGFEMNIIGYDPYIDRSKVPEWITVKDDMMDVFKESDFVSINMPLTPQTNRTIGMEHFKNMKQTAYIINSARGGIIREDELIEALKDKIIAGGAFDFLEKDPPDIDNPLFGFENVIITPHNAAITNEAMVLMGVQAAQGIHEVLSGKTPTWSVNNPLKNKVGS